MREETVVLNDVLFLGSPWEVSVYSFGEDDVDAESLVQNKWGDEDYDAKYFIWVSYYYRYLDYFGYGIAIGADSSGDWWTKTLCHGSNFSPVHSTNEWERADFKEIKRMMRGAKNALDDELPQEMREWLSDKTGFKLEGYSDEDNE